MILFQDDWSKYPDAIMDTKTTNKSAMDLALLFKEMGIANYGFILALHNTLLQGVDPYDENITKEQIVMIADECRDNPWYFFREVCYVPPASGTDPIKYRLNRGNVSMFWLFFNHITTFLMQPRQTGKSLGMDVIMTYLMGLGTVNTKFNLLTKDDALRVVNVTRLKDVYNELPSYLQLKNKSDTNNTEKITVNALGNVYTTNVGQPSVKGALKLGRGNTIAINTCDEIVFIPNIDKTLPALLAASSAARDNAKAAGAFYGNIFSSTAGYLNSTEGKFVYDTIYSKFMPWTEELYDSKDEKSLNEIIQKNTPRGSSGVLLEFNHRQLGYTDEWLRGKIADAMATGDAVLADFLNIWPAGNSGSPIPKELLKRLMDSKINDPYTEITSYGYVIRWYVTKDKLENTIVNRKLVVGSDTSDGVGNDDITLTFMDVHTGKTLGVGVFNETNLITFSDWLGTLFKRFQFMTMIIERKSSGVAIIDNLIKILLAHNIDPFKRLFNWVVDEYEDYPERFQHIKNRYIAAEYYTAYRKYFGYATSGSGKNSRENLYGAGLIPALKYIGDVVHDKQLIDQIAGLTVKNGRVDHKAGGHDDIVISWLLCYWFLTKAKNKIWYGIENREVLGKVLENAMHGNNSRETLAMKEYQLELKATIDHYLDLLQKEKDPIKINKLTIKIKMLSKGIDNKYIPVFDLNDVLNKILSQKHQRKY